MSKELTLSELEELLGSKERTLFYLTWLKHGRNATRAYLELHPNVTERSAGTLGSSMLGNIDMKVIASAYGLDTDKYFSILRDALEDPDLKVKKPYHDKLGNILGIEGPSQQINIQVNIPILGDKDAE